MLKNHNHKLGSALILKMVSMAIRFIFLMFYVPILAPGVFSDYYYYLTVSLLISYFLSFGVMDQIPVEFNKGEKSTHDFFILLTILLQILSIITLALSYTTESQELLIITLTIVSLAGLFTAGIIRSLNPFMYDITMNLPWVIAILLIFYAHAEHAKSLLLIVALARIITNFSAFLYQRIHKEFSIAKALIGYKKALSFAKKGFPKAISILLQLLYIRSPALIAKTYSDSITADTISMILSIVESLWQLYMVVVHRNYIKYLRIKNNISRCKIFSQDTMLLFTAFCILIPTWIILNYLSQSLHYQWLQIFNHLDYFIVNNLLIGSILALNNIRYFLWSKDLQNLVIQFEVLLVLTQLATYMASPHYYIYSIPLITFMLCSAFFFYIKHQKC